MKAFFFLLILVAHQISYAQNNLKTSSKMPIEKSEEEWKKALTPTQYHVLREKGTERPFTGQWWDNFENGEYFCSGCHQKLFDASTKFDAGCGWPSFYEVSSKDAIITSTDKSHGMIRKEVLCSHCGGHLGHVFKDGPTPTGLRYCINSASLSFKKEKPSK